MAGEIIYADLRHPGDSFSPAEKPHVPALCPRWHGVLLKVGGLGHLILLGLVVALSLQVFQGSLQPAATSASQRGGEIRRRNGTERCLISALMQYFCKSWGDNPAASAGCKLCPQDWQLHGGRCYWLSKEKGNWTEGEKGCEKLESQLVVLQDEKEKEYIKSVTGGGTQPVWIRFSSHLSLDTALDKRKRVGKVCSTLKNNVQEEDTCDGEHQWVCQKEPFQLSPPPEGDGEKCRAST